MMMVMVVSLVAVAVRPRSDRGAIVTGNAPPVNIRKQDTVLPEIGQWPGEVASTALLRPVTGPYA